ncbi:hypothetical protein ASG40_17850 [Methylobacterium sp. Leaf399]|uniref:hypothetical protein n=1 Tax=unclassified Methylobacterium TaxID=2615210 RepID=UPI0006FFCD28|nr:MULTISPECIES: hypothetical protein [unclassified Methylobacterium]KQP48866.1 hypothetical protein ASF39_13955 [Methylobacterium sp. Leaf108]KQT16559.1 hypothetical protein ASG40_17850 [Methylobacterium sp. Leaf399]KQT86622.1 hypothetical protein ASG59_17185 [Methylobacterium sp. Leaf466]
MTHRLAAAALAAALSLSAGAALAQSYNAPAGIPAATAPGGLTGRAAPYNLAEERHARGHAMRHDDIGTGSVRTRRHVPDGYGR